MSELPDGLVPARPPAPSSSSAAVLLCRAGNGWRALLGLRSRTTRFMPGHLAFPGGRLEEDDRPGSPGAWARCASRELREETGIAVEPESWLPAGERITPPLFPIRFRTRFFVAPCPAAVGATAGRPASEENDALELADPADVLRRWERGEARVPPPVLPILRVLRESGGAELAGVARRIAEANELEERAPRIEFHPGVWVLPQLTATLPPATCTNVWMPGGDGDRFVIIDPGGEAEAERRRLEAVVERRWRELGQRPSAVLLTHHHRDHAAGAAGAARVLEVPLVAHPATLEAAGLRSGDGLRVAPLGDGETIDLGGQSLEALHTPGHAAGHLAFWLPARRLLIAGDLVSGISTILVDPDGGDMDAFLASLRRVRALGGAALLPGHGPPLPWKALERVIAHRLERERRVERALGEGARGLAEVAARAYAGGPELPAPLIERQTLAHLQRLERQGRARCDGGAWSPGAGAEARR